MKKAIALAISMTTVAIVGCSSTDNSTAQSKSDNNYRCENTRTLGSMIPSKQCSTKKQREEARKASEDVLRESQSTGVLSGNN